MWSEKPLEFNPIDNCICGGIDRETNQWYRKTNDSLTATGLNGKTKINSILLILEFICFSSHSAGECVVIESAFL